MINELRSLFQQYEQDHVFKYYDLGKLSTTEIELLYNDLKSLDLQRISNIYKASMTPKEPQENTIQPLDSYDSIVTSSEESIATWKSHGLQAIGQGQVAALILAGGQGTRLGFDGPKGLYDIGLPSHKSLFQLFSERLLKLQQLAKRKQYGTSDIPLYIMTSQMNHSATEMFFKENDYFGLKGSQVVFFPQGTLPCLTKEGKIIMETGYKVARASDGNGGIYTALETTGALADMKQRNVKYVHTFSVDNAICVPVDPLFMGYCIDRGSDCGNKVVWKIDGSESVGVVAKKNGKYCVIEYSEMDEAIANKTDESGEKLLYGAANICNHFYTVAFLEKILSAGELEFHVAHKKIPYADENGNTIKPTSNTGIKLEAFIFDVFPLSENMAVFEALRENEFSPVKNAPGSLKDSPDTARRLLSSKARCWIEAAGGSFDHEHHLIKGIIQKKTRHRTLKKWKQHDLEFNRLTNAYSYKSGQKGTILSTKYDKEKMEFHCQVAAGDQFIFRVDSLDECMKWESAFQEATVLSEQLCEISPLVSYDGEDLDDVRGKTFCLPFHLTLDLWNRMHLRNEPLIQLNTMKSAHFNQCTDELKTALNIDYIQPIPKVENPHDVLIEIQFVGVTSIDIDMIKGSYTPTTIFPAIPGCEYTGIVRKIGKEVKSISLNDTVIGFNYGNCFAEYLVVSDEKVCLLPRMVSPCPVASLPFAGLSAWECIHEKLKISSEDKVIIVAGKDGNGHVAGQLVKLLGAAVCVVSSIQEHEKYKAMNIAVVSSLNDCLSELQGKATAVCNLTHSIKINPRDMETVISSNARIIALYQEERSVIPTLAFKTDILKTLCDMVVSKKLVLLPDKELPFEDISDALCTVDNGTQNTQFVLRMNPPFVSKSLREKFQNQEQVFQFYDQGTLSTWEIEQLVYELQTLNLQAAVEIFNTAPLLESELADKIPETAVPENKAYLTNAIAALLQQKIALVCLSNLQYDGSKGFTKPIGMISFQGKTLFQYYAEHVHDMQSKYSCQIPLFIVTNQFNHASIKQYFEINGNFGLKLQILCQPILPCFNFEGKLMLESSFHLAYSYFGNITSILKKLPFDYLQVFSIEQFLTELIDVNWLGYFITEQYQICIRNANHPTALQFIISRSALAELNSNFCLEAARIPCVSADGLTIRHLTQENGLQLSGRKPSHWIHILKKVSCNPPTGVYIDSMQFFQQRP